jgi:DNA-directed RNA polymerase specialized sigma24 family protein
MDKPTLPTAGRPPFWTLRIRSAFVMSLCPDVAAEYDACRIDLQEAQRRLLGRLRARVERVLLRYRSLDVEDATQNLVVRVAERGLTDRFDPGRCVSAWTYLEGVLRNVAHEMQRALRCPPSPDGAPVEAKPSRDRGPAEAAVEAEQVRRVRERYAFLTSRQRDALLVPYAFLEPGRTPPCPQPNEYVHRSRALSALRSDLREPADEPRDNACR